MFLLLCWIGLELVYLMPCKQVIWTTLILLLCRPLSVLSQCSFSYALSFSHFPWVQEHIILVELFFMVVQGFVCLLYGVSFCTYPLNSWSIFLFVNSIKQLAGGLLFDISSFQRTTDSTLVVILLKGEAFCFSYWKLYS